MYNIYNSKFTAQYNLMHSMFNYSFINNHKEKLRDINMLNNAALTFSLYN